MNTERFHNIEDIIGYTFRDLDLLVTALTHKSYANERKINKVESYERSEFFCTGQKIKYICINLENHRRFKS